MIKQFYFETYSAEQQNINKLTTLDSDAACRVQSSRSTTQPTQQYIIGELTFPRKIETNIITTIIMKGKVIGNLKVKKGHSTTFRVIV